MDRALAIVAIVALAYLTWRACQRIEAGGLKGPAEWWRKHRGAVLGCLIVAGVLLGLAVLAGGIVEVNADLDRAAYTKHQLDYAERRANDTEPCRSLDALDAAVDAAIEADNAAWSAGPFLIPSQYDIDHPQPTKPRPTEAAVQRAAAARDAAYTAAGKDPKTDMSCARGVQPSDAATVWEIYQMRLWDWAGWLRTWR